MPFRSPTGISALDSGFRRLRHGCGPLFLLAVLLTVVLASCTSEPTLVPTPAPAPEPTALPPTATVSLQPAATPVAVPTSTAPAAATPAPTPTFEELLNEIRASATSITVGKSVRGDKDFQGDTEFFSFQSEAGQTYRIELSSSLLYGKSPGSPWPLTLYDSGGLELAAFDQATYWEAQKSGPLYIAVAKSQTDSYSLTVKPACPTGTTEREWFTDSFWVAANLAQIRVELDCGANVNAKSKNDWTVLHLAAFIGDKPVIQTLLDAGAKAEVKDIFGKTPLHMTAALSDDPAAVQALLDAGADIEAKDDQDWTPLRYAAGNENPEVIQTLLDAGADIRADTGSGRTVLHSVAAGNKNPEVIQTLLKAGADLEAKSNSGWTPLHFAAESNENPVVVQALLDAGANVNARNSDGETPLAVAIKHDNQPAIQVLQGAGASE